MAKKRAAGGTATSPPASSRPLEPIVARAASGLGAALTPEVVERLAAFAALVRTWNARVNLTAARDDASLCEVLLADALVLRAHELVPQGSRLLDVGTGAGAPLLPLLVLREDVSAVSLEPLHKRAAFLRTAAARLGLTARLQVREERVDERAPVAPGGPFDVACSRATFAPETWLRAGLALAPAVLVLTAGERPAPPAQACESHAREYALPFSSAPRRITRYERRS